MNMASTWKDMNKCNSGMEMIKPPILTSSPIAIEVRNGPKDCPTPDLDQQQHTRLNGATSGVPQSLPSPPSSPILKCTFTRSTLSPFSSLSPPLKAQMDDMLSGLPPDVLYQTLSFLDPNEVDRAVKLTCISLQQASNTEPLWKEFCIRTGKIPPEPTPSLPEHSSNSINDQQEGKINKYRAHYYRNPCVPVDAPTISEALEICPISGGMVTLMPGIYDEVININSRRRVSIRAAFPEKGAALVHCWYRGESREVTRGNQVEYEEVKDEPCINICLPSLQGDRDPNIIFHERDLFVHLSHIQILHSTPGSDIWGGNCAVRVDGCNAHLTVDCCTLQSDSGRGIVITNGASMEMTRTVLHDCAATGLYVGDQGTQAKITACNIIRNGGGSRRIMRNRRGRDPSSIPRARDDYDLDDYMLHDSSTDEEDEDDEDEFMLAAIANNVHNDLDVVPPGHSGMYVETASAAVENTLLANNSLTGLSVVRGGAVRLSGCDITLNGAEPVTFEDVHDLHDENINGGVIRGGVIEGPKPNNYESRGESNISLPQQNVLASGTSFLNILQRSSNELPSETTNHQPSWLYMGGFVQPTPFPRVITGELTERKLYLRHMSHSAGSSFDSDSSA